MPSTLVCHCLPPVALILAHSALLWQATVVIKHMFDPAELASEPGAAAELEAEVLEEATKLGPVEKVRCVKRGCKDVKTSGQHLQVAAVSNTCMQCVLMQGRLQQAGVRDECGVTSCACPVIAGPRLCNTSGGCRLDTLQDKRGCRGEVTPMLAVCSTQVHLVSLLKEPHVLVHLQACLQRMHGRFFDGRRLTAEMWDGLTNYAVKVSVHLSTCLLFSAALHIMPPNCSTIIGDNAGQGECRGAGGSVGSICT
jgi:hypothetical protein